MWDSNCSVKFHKDSDFSPCDFQDFHVLLMWDYGEMEWRLMKRSGSNRGTARLTNTVAKQRERSRNSPIDQDGRKNSLVIVFSLKRSQKKNGYISRGNALGREILPCSKLKQTPPKGLISSNAL